MRSKAEDGQIIPSKTLSMKSRVSVALIELIVALLLCAVVLAWFGSGPCENAWLKLKLPSAFEFCNWLL